MEHDSWPAGAKYVTGDATLRSSAHSAGYSKARKTDRGPVTQGVLPDAMRNLELIDVFVKDGETDLRPVIARLLARADPAIGAWPCTSVAQTDTCLKRGSGSPETSTRSCPKKHLEDFAIPPASLASAKRAALCVTSSTWVAGTKAGTIMDAQASLAQLVAQDDAPGGFLFMFDEMLEKKLLPVLKQRLVACGAVGSETTKIKFYIQRPPTLRLQPGPSSRYVRPHRDHEYGHQDGEINFWLPLTDPRETGVDLEVESAPDLGDFARTNAAIGQAVAFHGTSKKHKVGPNASHATRASIDFRVGIETYFDPKWSMAGTKADHDRKVFEL